MEDDSGRIYHVEVDVNGVHTIDQTVGIGIDSALRAVQNQKADASNEMINRGWMEARSSYCH